MGNTLAFILDPATWKDLTLNWSVTRGTRRRRRDNAHPHPHQYGGNILTSHLLKPLDLWVGWIWDVGLSIFPLKFNLSLFYLKFDMLFFSLIYFISEFLMPSHLWYIERGTWINYCFKYPLSCSISFHVKVSSRVRYLPWSNVLWWMFSTKNNRDNDTIAPQSDI